MRGLIMKEKIWLSTPTMHGEEMDFVREAYETNWMSTVGENINEVEKLVCEKVGCKYAVGLSAGTAALHMAVKLAGVKPGDKVFCSDMTFAATVNPVVYEGGVPVFIDTEYDTWNMDPAALEKAFEIYPDVKLVVYAHLYGTPAKIDEITKICKKHGAMIIEDAAESLGASYKGKQTGDFGNFNAISFNGNKIITGSSGGMLLTDCKESADKARKWSTQSRENAPWYQHEEIGYNYRMSNVIAGVVRGQFPHLEEHIAKKKEIYMRYKEGFEGLPVSMNPYDEKNSEPNFWLSCMIIDEEALHIVTPEKIRLALETENIESRPIWKPMHMQPVYSGNDYIMVNGDNVGEDIFKRGLCLPSDVKMTAEQQKEVISIIKGLF
ncbi:MAG: aminotransferase class V-fold PLP-dependent enzyme [Clostridia bacterium]|nr:aminotransferase class V-fold PLP-dependent enzyme [Clostridia bacterium]